MTGCVADARGPVSPAVAGGGRLTVDGLTLRVRTSARRKRFALTVETDAEVTLHAPEARSTEDAEEFVRAHRGWLADKLRARERVRPLNPPKRLVEGEVFRYLGRTYRLAMAADGSTDHRVRLVAGRLIMNRGLVAAPDRGRAALVDWYCRAGHAWAAGRLQPWAARMAVAEPKLEVRDLGARWGTYRPGKGGDAPALLSLGWPLFQLPMHLVDYVVAHELAHVRIAGHGREFWRLLRSALPECQAYRAELDELGRRMWMGDIVR